MTRWSAHTTFPSIGSGTDLLIFEETISGAPFNDIGAGDAINVTLRGASRVIMKGRVIEANQDSAVIVLTDGSSWKMTPRRPDEAPSMRR
jgi:hypothetical protein